MPSTNFPQDTIVFDPLSVEFTGTPTSSNRYYVKLSVSDWYSTTNTYIDMIVAAKPIANILNCISL